MGKVAEMIKQTLLKGETVTIQGTDKNLSYMIVSSLAQLLIDPFYRTLEGKKKRNQRVEKLQ